MHEATHQRAEAQAKVAPVQNAQPGTQAALAAHQYWPGRQVQAPEEQACPPVQATQAVPPVPQAALPVPG